MRDALGRCAFAIAALLLVSCRALPGEPAPLPVTPTPTPAGLEIPVPARIREPAPPPAPRAELLHRVTYEDGESLLESAQTGTTHGLTLTEETARTGQRAGEALLHADDPQRRGFQGYRSEWQSVFRAALDTEYWYSISYFVPSDWHQGENGSFADRIIFQFHEGTGAPPAFSLHLSDDEPRFFVRRRAEGGGFHYLWSMPADEERWYDFAFQVKWTHEQDGYFRIYLNGRLVRNYRGPTLVDGFSIYTKWGIYGQPTRVLFDEVRIAQGAGGLRVVSP